MSRGAAPFVGLVLCLFAWVVPVQAQGAARSVTPGSAPAADLDWRIEPLGEAPIRLASFAGRVLFINVWASWCRPCVAEMASIEALADSLAGTGVEFILVSPEGEPEVRRFLERHRLAVPVYLEAEPAPASYDVLALPTTLVVDRSGRLVLHHRGAADWNQPEVRSWLRRLADEQ